MNVRRIRSTVLLLTILLLAGCFGQTPVNRWASGRDTLTRAQDTVRFAHQAQMIDDPTLLKADAVVQAVRAALDRAEQELPDGGDDFAHYMAIVEAMLDRLAVMAAAGELQLE